MNPSVSIIIPVFNIQCYLRECLDSIVNQDFENYEVIVVDDGSTDESPIICDEYAKNHRKIKVIHKDNGGVSTARNIGLDNAQGEWIWFVDADDYIENDALSKLSDEINRQCDTIFHGFAKVYENGEIIADMHNEELGVDKKDFLMRHYCFQNGMILFSSRIIKENNLRYSEGIRMGEDLEFQYKYLLLCKAPIRIKNSLYFYRQREGSAIANPNSHRNNVKDCMLVANNLLQFVKQHNVQEEFWFSKRVRILMKGVLQSAETLSYEDVNDIGKEIKLLLKGYKEAGFTNIEDKTIKLATANTSMYFCLLRLYYKVKSIR